MTIAIIIVLIASTTLGVVIGAILLGGGPSTEIEERDERARGDCRSASPRSCPSGRARSGLDRSRD